MSFLDLHKLWSKVTPLFSVGSQLRVPVIQHVIILKQVVPIVIGLLKDLCHASGTRYQEFAINLGHSLSLVAANIPVDHYHAEWDNLSLTAHESARACHLKHNKPFPIIEDLSPKKSKPKTKAAHKVLQSVEIVARKPKLVRKIPDPIIYSENEEPGFDKSSQDSGEDSFEEPPRPVKPPPAPKSPVVGRLKAGPSKNLVAVVFEKDKVPPVEKAAPTKKDAGLAAAKKVTTKAGKADPHTQSGKRKCDEDITAAEGQASTSNVWATVTPALKTASEKAPPAKKAKGMSKEEKAELGRKAAVQVPSCDIGFKDIDLRIVRATDVSWLVTTDMDPNLPCSLCLMGTQTKPCEFLGWGVACGNCQHGKKVVCSFKVTPHERYRAHISIALFAECTPDNLHRQIRTASHLVKVFDVAIEAAGCLTELLHHQVAEIDKIVHETVEFKGQMVAETALLEDVSVVNYILAPHQPKEPAPASDPETPVASGFQHVTLTYDKVDSKSEEVQAMLEVVTDSPAEDTVGEDSAGDSAA
ncbi:hypothetical protein IW261DRAFT_1573452 [Armillaria novae-zelandiae]|uniref:Uncharacterized protein n=1 Tax=Armillaria novae-zelandiae TaxID=153914 RepID=A0AA39NN56_9AGAR|nr:hypothetical protein IW261DRAFT_1573452 [Armillaria novae-zelandiae]